MLSRVCKPQIQARKQALQAARGSRRLYMHACTAPTPVTFATENTCPEPIFPENTYLVGDLCDACTNIIINGAVYHTPHVRHITRVVTTLSSRTTTAVSLGVRCVQHPLSSLPHDQYRTPPQIFLSLLVC